MAAVIASLGAYAAAFMAVLLLASAGHMLISKARMREAVMALTGVPAWAAMGVLAAAAVVEAGVTLALLLPATRFVAALAAAGLWGAYLVLILRAGRAVDCGCTFGGRAKASTAAQGGRNVGLVAMALLAAAAARVSPPPGIDLLYGVAALGLFALYLALDQLSALTSPGAVT